MTPLPSLIFDLDGTLIDSVPDLTAAVNRLLAEEGHAPMQRSEVQSYVGDGAPMLVKRVMVARGLASARHQELTDRLVTDYTKRSSELTTIYPDVVDVLAMLRQRGHRLGLCTNKPGRATSAVLDALGLAGLFDTVVAGDTCAERKPHPAPLLAAAAPLGLPSIFIGDSVVDARTAEAAGIPFLLFEEGYLHGSKDEIRFAGAFRAYRDLVGLVDAVMHAA